MELAFGEDTIFLYKLQLISKKRYQKLYTPVTNGTVSQVSPTDLGKEYIPSLKKWSSNRASGLAVLKANDFEYESYADDGVKRRPNRLPHKRHERVVYQLPYLVLRNSDTAK